MNTTKKTLLPLIEAAKRGHPGSIKLLKDLQKQ